VHVEYLLSFGNRLTYVKVTANDKVSPSNGMQYRCD